MHSDGASLPNSKNEIHSEVITLKEAIQDIAFGSIAGMVSEVFEYPFDLAKVRLQSQLLSPTGSDGQPRFKGPMDCLMQTWRDEGVKGLYRVSDVYFLSVSMLTVLSGPSSASCRINGRDCSALCRVYVSPECHTWLLQIFGHVDHPTTMLCSSRGWCSD